MDGFGAQTMANVAWANQTEAACERISELQSRLSEAGIIREQIAEAHKVADSILQRLIGPRPEEGCEEAQKDPHSGGALGDMARIQAASIDGLADLRRVIEQLGKHI